MLGCGDGVVGLAVEVGGLAGGELADGADAGCVRSRRRRDYHLRDGVRDMVMVDGREGFLVDIFVGFEAAQRWRYAASSESRG